MSSIPPPPPEAKRTACPACKASRPWLRFCTCPTPTLAAVIAAASAGQLSKDAAAELLGERAHYTARTVVAPFVPAPRPSSVAGPKRAAAAAVVAGGECRACGVGGCVTCAQPPVRVPRRARPLPPTADDGREQRAERRAAEWRERNRKRGCPRFAPLNWTAPQFARAGYLMTHATAAHRAWLKLPPVMRSRVERAALAMVRDERGFLRPSRTWAHIRARRVLAVAVVLYEASSEAKRLRGHARVLRGITRGQIAALFTNPVTGRHYSTSTMFATSNDAARVEEWHCGDVVALARAGVLWSHQPPAATSDDRWVGRDRHGNPRALAEYYWTDRAVHGAEDAEHGEPSTAHASQLAAEAAEAAAIAAWDAEWCDDTGDPLPAQ